MILERLVEVLLVEALRFRSASASREARGLLARLSDPALARTLREIHIDVARRWTVEQLARTAGMSRATFADRFTRTVGMPAMQYLLEWRVAHAKAMLRNERPSFGRGSRKSWVSIGECVQYSFHTSDWYIAQRVRAFNGLKDLGNAECSPHFL